MPAVAFTLTELRLSIRFIRGYRYLDRCGEALIKLEDVLDSKWIPGEISPKGGVIRNDVLGMETTFHSEGLNVTQSGLISFEHFRDQACKIVDVLRSTFSVDKYLSPGVGLTYQQGFEENDIEIAEKTLIALGLLTISPALIREVGGSTTSMNFAILTKVADNWNGLGIEHNRRIAGQVVRQVRQDPIDTRLVSRVKLLPQKQRDAMEALRSLRKMHPTIKPVAVQLDLENRLEGELPYNELVVHDFLTESESWARSVVGRIPNLRQMSP